MIKFIMPLFFFVLFLGGGGVRAASEDGIES